jgi:hypothetical protein
MKKIILLLIIGVTTLVASGQTNGAMTKDAQIKAALLAAPADKRDSATVYGYDDKGEMITLREGTNEIICISDDPKGKGFSVSSYHRDLHPFMQRGRELRKGGMSQDQIFKTREAEAKSGKLILPKQPATLYVFSAKDEDVNKTAGDVKNGYLRYVIYIPYATAQSTGLTEKPEQPGMPWIMHPGTHGAHIMINPPVAAK